MNRKLLKKKGKERFKRNYWHVFAVCFVFTLLVGGTTFQGKNEKEYVVTKESVTLDNFKGKTNSDIVNDFLNSVNREPIEEGKYHSGVLSGVVNNVSKSGSFLFGILNACNQFLFQDHIFAGIILVIGALIGFIYWLFVAKVLEVGKSRFFLENHGYEKTSFSRILLPYKVRKMVKVSFAMVRKTIYQALWTLTIVGGVIKHYSYYMVSFLLAENPTLTGKEAIRISREMMNHHKWETFILELSFIWYHILGVITFNLSNLFYKDLYMEATRAELYFALRKEYSSKNKNSLEIFKDNYLEPEKDLDIYPEKNYFLPEHESRKWLKLPNYERKYSWDSYILLFFAFSMLGWIWEVALHLFSEGVFVNRGTLFGPWLPIYGSGGVLIVFLLQKIRKKPFLTFLCAVLICGVIEYGTAWYLETYKGMKWWDYSGYFLNLDGRICLEGLFFFGIGGLAFVYILAPFFDHFIRKINLKLRWILCVILVLCIGADFIHSSEHPNTGNGVTSNVSSKE